MSWAKIDGKLHSHPRVIKASLDAMGLWALALSWCAADLTDGHIPTAQVVCLGGDDVIAQELVNVGLWEETEDGYLMTNAIRWRIGGAKINRDAPAFVYLMQCGNLYKIGVSNDVDRRQGEIQRDLRKPLEVIASIYYKHPYSAERGWHGLFSSKRKIGEWFALADDDVTTFTNVAHLFIEEGIND